MATYTALIGGSSPGNEVTVLRDGFTMTRRASGIGTLICQVLSDDGSPYYRPESGDEIYILRDSTVIFGGHIEDADEMGFGGPNLDQIVTLITANDFNAIGQWRYFLNTTIPAGTLKSAAQVVATLLASHGVTLDPTMPEGPLVPEMIFDKKRASEVLDAYDQATRQGSSTGWTHQIDDEKVLRFTNTDPAGSPAESLDAPWDLIEGEGSECGDLKIKKALTDQYANKVIVRSGTVTDQIDSFTGDGVTDTFNLTARILGPGAYHYDSTCGYAVVDYNGSESLGGVGAAGTIWEYDPAALTIRRRLGAPGNGDPFQIRYQTDYQPFVTANDVAEQDLRGVREHVEDVENVSGSTDLQAIADAILLERAPFVTATYPTRRAGLDAGQVQRIVSARRDHIDAEFLITEITANFDLGDELLYTVVAEKTRVATGTWEQTLAQWSRGGSTAPAFVATPAAIGGTPALPYKSVQYNATNQFGGDSGLLRDASAQTLEADGTDGTIITRTKYNGAPTYGPEVLAAQISSIQKNEHMLSLALGNSNKPGEEFTVWQTNGGTLYMQQDSAAQWNIQKTGANAVLDISAPFPRIKPNRTTGYWGVLESLWLHDAECQRVNRVTGTTHTIDSGFSGGGGIYGTYLFDPSADATIALPALSSNTVEPVAGWARLLRLKNISSTYTVTLDGDSSETIDGDLTLTLPPGASVILLGYNGTGANWRVFASHTPTSLLLRKATLTLTNAQFKTLPSTQFTIVPAPIAGQRWKPIGCSVSKDFSSGAYTGVDTTYATLVVQTHGGSWVANAIVNDTGTNPDLADLTALVAANARVVDLVVPSLSALPNDSAGNAEWVDVTMTSDPAFIGGATNGALELAMDNNGSTSDLGGGHASNMFTLTIYYMPEAL